MEAYEVIITPIDEHGVIDHERECVSEHPNALAAGRWIAEVLAAAEPGETFDATLIKA